MYKFTSQINTFNLAEFRQRSDNSNLQNYIKLKNQEEQFKIYKIVDKLMPKLEIITLKTVLN